jgi:uncharacterized protein YdiU (UPF0061 family)
VSVAPTPTVTLDNRFARELPQMAVAWRADEVPDPRLLVLNERLATDLGLDPDFLHTADGRRLLVGNLVPDGRHPGGAGVRGSPVRRVRPATRRRTGPPAR